MDFTVLPLRTIAIRSPFLAGETVASSQGVVTRAPDWIIATAVVMTDRTFHNRPPSLLCNNTTLLPRLLQV